MSFIDPRQALHLPPLCRPKYRDRGLLQCPRERPPDPTLGGLVVEQTLLRSPAFCLPLCRLPAAEQLCWGAGVPTAFPPAVVSAEPGGRCPTAPQRARGAASLPMKSASEMAAAQPAQVRRAPSHAGTVGRGGGD